MKLKNQLNNKIDVGIQKPIQYYIIDEKIVSFLTFIFTTEIWIRCGSRIYEQLMLSLRKEINTKDF